MILALLACAHVPPNLYPVPIRRETVGEQPPADGPEPPVLAEGMAAPHVGLLVRSGDWDRLKLRSRLLTVSTGLLTECYDGWQGDRLRAQSYADAASFTEHQLRGQVRVGDAKGVAGLMVGFAIGAGTAIGALWATRDAR